MGDCRKADFWNMPRAGINALAVPDRFARFRKEIGQKSAAIGGCKDTGIAPLITLKRSNIKNVNHEDIARLRTGDFDRSNEMMARGKITITYVGGVIVILDLTTSPV